MVLVQCDRIDTFQVVTSRLILFVRGIISEVLLRHS